MFAQPGIASDSTTPYATLSERAIRYVTERGGSVPEDALIAFVFGTAGPPTLWQPLLRQILANEDRLLHRPDGCWSLAHLPQPATAGMLRDFVAIDVETTGLQPLRQRVIEIALLRFRDGAVVERVSTLVNPQKRIPKFISTLTGIDNDHVVEAPVFSSIAATVAEFLDGALLVGHNVGFDINFVNAELGRAGLPSLVNERLDVMGLAMRLLPGLKRPSLDKVALQLGLNPRKIHRADVDAELAGNAAIHLAARAKDVGIDSLDRLRAIGTPTKHLTAIPTARGSTLIDRAILSDVPKCPGVYLMLDTNDRIIYIGKAKNLRDRVSSYFSQPLGYTRKMDGLLESIARIETERTGSELAALLLESQLIRRYQPRYNVAMRAAEEYPFIRVDLANPWPRITVAKARKDDGAVYFGPFKSRKAVRAAIELVNDNYPLRTCTRSFKTASSYGAPCIRLDLGKCFGPCVGRANRDVYMGHVRDAVAFLEGDHDVLLQRMHEQLENCAGRLDFERARQLRNSIQLLQSLIGAHRRLKQAQERNTLVVVQAGVAVGSRDLMLVIRGQLWSRFIVKPDDDPAEIAIRLADSWDRHRATALPAIDHATLDDVNILNRWIARADGGPAVIRLPTDGDVPWGDVVRRAIQVPEAALANPMPDDFAEARGEAALPLEDAEDGPGMLDEGSLLALADGEAAEL